MAIPDKVYVSGSIDFLLNVGGTTTRVKPDPGGQAIFTPAMDRVVTSVDDQVSEVGQVVVDVDSQGRLVAGGNVELIDLSSPNLAHRIREGQGTWEVSFANIRVGGELRPLRSFWIVPTPTGTDGSGVNKLARLLTVKASGQVIAKGQPGRGITAFVKTALDKIRPVYDDGTQGDEIAQPLGPPGPSGPTGPQGLSATGAAEDDVAISVAAKTALSETNKVLDRAQAIGASRQLMSAKTKNVAHTASAAQVIVSFIDDDTHTEAFTRIRPIANAKGVPYCFAAIAGSIKTADPIYCTPANLLTMQAEGHEIMSHTWTHTQLATQTIADWPKEMGESKVYLESLGLRINHLVYPGGSYNDAVVDLASSYYDSAWTVAGGTNRTNGLPLNTYRGLRRDLDNNTLAQAKTWVDEALASPTGAWLVFTTHGWYEQWAQAAKQQDLADLIDYVKGLGVPIMTIADGFERLGNVISVGDINNGKDWFFVDKQGREHSRRSRAFAEPANTILPTTPPGFFRNNATTITHHNGATQATGFPDANIGTLVTLKGLDNLVEQTWYPYQNTNTKNHCWKRTNNNADPNKQWNAWVRVLTVQPATETKVAAGDPTLSSYPNSQPGTLRTTIDTTNGFYVELYDVFNSPRRYKRYRQSDGTMSPWRAVVTASSHALTTGAAPTSAFGGLAVGASADIAVDVSGAAFGGLTRLDSWAVTWRNTGPPAGLRIDGTWASGTNDNAAASTVTVRITNAGPNAVGAQALPLLLIAGTAK